MDSISLKKSFPIFTNQPELVYLDSAATALKPISVIDAERYYSEHISSNIARGTYPLAEQATEAFENTRKKAAAFLNAQPEEIIFTTGTTHGLNLVAQLLETRIEPGDNLIVTAAEHHSNFLPWKELAKRRGAELRVLPILPDGTIEQNALASLVDVHTKVLAFSAISNVLGIINPVASITKTVRAINPDALIVVDAAQAIGHIPVDVVLWDVDFLAFSGHKMFGPTGTGILFGKHAILETLTPVSFGGGMVLDACAPETLYKKSPACFEAGTPHIAGIIGLGAAFDFITAIGITNIRSHDVSLLSYALRRLAETFGKTLQIIGTQDLEQKSGILSFMMTAIHPHDVAYLLGEKNICVRAGLQCAAPLHQALDLSASIRLSLSVYNTEADIDQLITGLQRVRTIL